MPINPKKPKPILSAELRAVAREQIRKAKANKGCTNWLNSDWYRSSNGNPTLITNWGSEFGAVVRATIIPDRRSRGRYCYTLGIEGVDGRISAGGYATVHDAKVAAFERLVADFDELTAVPWP